MYKAAQHIVALLIFFGLGNSTYAQSFIDTVCEGETAGPYRTAPSAGSVYYWTVEDGTISSYTTDGAAITVEWGLTPGVKKITVLEVSAYGCPGDTVVAYVLILPKGKVDILGPDQVCRGETTTLQAVGNADRYLWSNGSSDQSIVFYADKDTSFTVTGFFGECGTSVSLHDLQVKYRPAADFDFTPKKPILDEPVKFTYTGTNNVDNWGWTFIEQGQQPGNAGIENPEYTFDKPGIKAIKLLVRNDFGCTDTITKYILVEAGINVFVPSGFTPNHDGLNAVFIPVYENVLSAKLLVYNRWGELVFSTEKMDEGWDGTHGEKPVPDGVYVYIVQVVGKDNKPYTFDGTVTVAR